MPPAPVELIYLRYRQAMHISWQEFLATPWEVVNMDLQILDVEATVLKSKKGK